MKVEVRGVGTIIEGRDLKLGDLFLQRVSARGILSLRVGSLEETGELRDLILAMEGPPIAGVDRFPTRLAQLALSRGPYELIDYQVIARPRSLLKTLLAVVGGCLVVDGDGPMIAYGQEGYGRELVLHYDLVTGKPREPAIGALVYPSWELVRIDNEGNAQMLASFG